MLLLALLLSLAPETYTYWIQSCTRPETGCQTNDEDLARWALEAWERASGGRLKVERVLNREDARIQILWAGSREGLYGEARPIFVKGKPGAEVYVRPDLTGLGPAIAASGRDDVLFRHTVVYLTCLHESGHALGLPHTRSFDDIMYAFGYGGDIREYFARYRRRLQRREDIPKHSGLSPADEKHIQSLH